MRRACTHGHEPKGTFEIEQELPLTPQDEGPIPSLAVFSYPRSNLIAEAEHNLTSSELHYIKHHSTGS